MIDGIIYLCRVDHNKYQIHIPLPPKIDPSVKMMNVEENSNVTYNDFGGCKEQIEKMREVCQFSYKSSSIHISYFLIWPIVPIEYYVNKWSI